MSGFNDGPVAGTEGKKTNPAASTLLADTGALTTSEPARGPDLFAEVIGWMETAGASGATFIIEHRNAANDGNIRTMEVNFDPGGNVIIPYIANMADGERLRVIQGAVTPGAGTDVQVLITGRAVSRF